MEILTLGNKIKNRRKELNLTLKELAGNRVTPAQLSYVETDKCKPSIDLLEYIAEKLELEMDYLLESEKKQVSRYCDYNIKLSRIDLYKDNIEDAKKRIVDVINVSREYNLTNYIGEAEKHLALVYYKQKDYDKAKEYYLNALQEFSVIDNYNEIILLYIQLGIIAREKGYNDASITYFMQAERFTAKLKYQDAFLELNIYFNLMQIYKDMNDRNKLDRYSNKIVEILKSVNDISVYGDNLLSISKLFEFTRNYDKVMDCLNRSLTLYDYIYNIQFVSKIKTSLGNVYSTYNRIEDSFGYLDRALEIKRFAYDDELPLTLIEKANNYISIKDYDNAFKSINEALNIAISTNNKEYESLAYFKLYYAFKQKGEFIKAEDSIRRYADILECSGDAKRLAECYFETGMFYKGINREKEALDYICKSLDVYKKSYDIFDICQIV